MEGNGDGLSGSRTDPWVGDPENGRSEPGGRTRLSTTVPNEVALKLRALGRQVSPAEISDVWVFPPLPDLEGSAEFLLFTRLYSDEAQYVCAAEFSDGTRQTAHREAPRNGDASGGENGADPHLTGRIREYGTVPSTRIPRLVAGLRRRLGDGRTPLHLEIGGCPVSWDRLVTIGEVESYPDD